MPASKQKSFSLTSARRKIRANDSNFNAQFNYADNYIRTSKYSLLTFLPLNLFEQFRRLANFYFLTLLILQLIPQISSLTPITTAVPLVVVLALTGIKDAHDDICRHQSDRQVNNRLSQLLRNGKLVNEPWHKVKVGDIIRIENDQFVAADLMILATSEPNGFCFVETAELDGETNLKCRQCLPETAALQDSIELWSQFDGEIICEQPNNNLIKFEGTLFWQDRQFAVDNDKMLLRGCIVRNTKWTFGLVIFAGRDTKLMQNSGETIFKRTKSDKLLNILILGIVFALLTICLFTSLACFVWELFSGKHLTSFIKREQFIVNMTNSPASTAIITAALVFFSYLIVLNTVVPISLYVSVEVIRYCQSLLIDFDTKMYYRPKNAYAKARTTTLNEELGQVEYVFSDKTGTLTQNLMTFNKCTINGTMFGEALDFETNNLIDICGDNEHLYEPVDFSSFNPQHYEEKFKFYDSSLLKQVQANNSQVREFFLCLALCHTVMSELKPNGKLEYQAQSPDEAALSSAARNFGFVFKGRTASSIDIEVLGVAKTYELLAILDFNNVRKRMSVIVRCPDTGRLVLYCKGADSVIFERLNLAAAKCNPTIQSLHDTTAEHLDKFASVGLRTLCLAKKELGADEFEAWQAQHHKASTAIDDREAKVDKCCEAIEQSLELIGATAIEDKLQDNVPKTIANLIAANIKVWVLTGDKQETAINIGFSCELLDDDMCEIFVVDGAHADEVERQLRRCQRRIAKALRTKSRLEALKLAGGWGRTQTDAECTPLRQPSIADHCAGSTSHRSTSTSRAPPPPPPPSKQQKCQSRPKKRSKDAAADCIELNSTHPKDSNNNNTSSNLNSSSIFTVNLNATTTASNNNHIGNNNGQSHDLVHPTVARPASQSTNNAQQQQQQPLLGSGDVSGGFALVISGQSLAHALCPSRELLFLAVACECKSVICCRVTPLQKALVVDMVKRHKKVITLSIGDGANDVSMLKMAHIGVGISGQEGMQAVLASDYAIAQFCYLERLVLVHGRWSYLRMCRFLRYFFYKNFSFTLCNLWYAFFCGFSAQTLFDPFFISCYNVFYTSLPVLAIGIFDQDVDDRFSTKFPLLYTPGHMDLLFNKAEFLKSVAQGIVTSFTTFFITYGAFKEAVDAEGVNLDGHELFGCVVSTNLVVAVTAQVALDTSYWTVFNHIVIWGSLIVYLTMTFAFNTSLIRSQYLGVFGKVLNTPTFWFCLFLVLVVLCVPIIGYRFYNIDVKPTLADRCRYIQRLSRRKIKPIEPQFGRQSLARKSRRSIRSGYAFSHQEGFGNLITSGMLIKARPPSRQR